MDENKIPLITHPKDPRFRSLRFLQTFQGRRQTGLYIMEGIRHLARAEEHRAPIRSVFFEPSTLISPFGMELARRLCQRGVLVVRLTRQLYSRLTLARDPQGIGATLRQHWTPLESLYFRADSLWLAVESIESPGNLGTILRTAEAANVAGVFLLGERSDPFDPASVRASMGSLFAEKLIRCSAREFKNWARLNGVCLVGSSPAGPLDYKALPYRRPAALLIGSEKRGLSGELAEAADFMVRIPMHGRCDSINAAVATGVFLFEMSSQQRVLEGGPKSDRSHNAG